jgi:dephospho-CoA kinase
MVARFFEVGEFEPMGIPAEAQLIVPKLRPLQFEGLPLICLAGMKGAGKSVVARYLSLFFGFHWLRTRDLIRQLLIEDMKAPLAQRAYKKELTENQIIDSDLTEFGVIILERYKQKPLVRKLKAVVADIQRPVVIDAARDLADFDTLRGFHGEPVLWYIDAPDTAIRNRLADSRRTGKKNLLANNRIDQKMSILRSSAHARLTNDSSLEDLRWRVDDILFQVFHLHGT